MNEIDDEDLVLPAWPAGADPSTAPRLAAARRHGGAPTDPAQGTGGNDGADGTTRAGPSGRTACVLDVLQADGTRLHWLDSPQARGWIAASQSVTPAAFAGVFRAALAAGFTGADAAMLASVPGASPQGLPPGSVLPRLSWGEAPLFVARAARPVRADRPLGLYGLVDSAERMREALDAGLRTVQLRLKTPAQPAAHWPDRLRGEIAACVALARDAGAELFINDHWREAAALGAPGVHLGQEDLLAMDELSRAALVASGIGLGISSHSLWELCRARALAPRYIACGPVWPTVTKDMPWRPQGLDNLAWWCRWAGAPVVAIGGILSPGQAADCIRAGADGVCVVRALGDAPRQAVPAFQAVLDTARRDARHAGADAPTSSWPHPMLPAA